MGQRSEKELRDTAERTGCTPSHKGYCGFPSEPCSCEVYNERERRTTHKQWCDYPSGPCDCGLN